MSNGTSKKVVLCYSGGLDSTVLLHLLKAEGYDVYCLSVDYGQRHDRELKAAYNICLQSDTRKHKILDFVIVSQLFQGSGSSQIGESFVPEGHYAEESMKATVVPNRNMILLSLAAAWAISLKAEGVAYAAHAGDHTIYPDCRPNFMTAMWTAIQLCDWNPPHLYCPFGESTKADIVRLGYNLGQDCIDAMGLSYSCYKGGEKHCGKCGTCVERREAFQLVNVPDPTVYEDETKDVPKVVY